MMPRHACSLVIVAAILLAACAEAPLATPARVAAAASQIASSTRTPMPASTQSPLASDQRCSRASSDTSDAGFDEHERVWCDTQYGLPIKDDELTLLTGYPCGRERVARIWIGTPVGERIDTADRHEYLRDPDGYALGEGWIDQPWRGDDDPPSDARSTGWTNGNVELWVSPSEHERFVWLRRGSVFERWPRADSGWGVTDCN
jgi:hypothetical protein